MREASICLFLLFSVLPDGTSNNIVTTDKYTNTTEELSSMSNYTEFLVEEYFPVLLVLVNLPKNETDALEKYLKQRTYAELKRMIDVKTIEASIAANEDLAFGNFTNVLHFLETEESQKYLKLIEAYHNASVYALIRGVWNSQLYTILPPIDQLAILEYFEEKTAHQNANKSLFQRLWEAIQRIFVQHSEMKPCAADYPECMRKLTESMEKSDREEIEQAADEDDVLAVEGILSNEINRLPNDLREEFAEWRLENYPPTALLSIVYDAHQEEKEALQRLRIHGLVSSLKNYYRAMIEMKPIEDQEEIRQFFRRMNDTFARCYNPLRNKYSNGFY